MTNAILRGKPDAGNPHVRFDEGKVASAATPRRGSLLYNLKTVACAGLACAAFGALATDNSTISWNVSSADWMDWNTPGAWSLVRVPAYGDKVGLTVKDADTRVRLASAVEPIEQLLVSPSVVAKGRLDVAAGGHLVVTNGEIVLVGGGLWDNGTGAYGELNVSGGTVSNLTKGLNFAWIGHRKCTDYRSVFRQSAGETYVKEVVYATWLTDATYGAPGYTGLFDLSGGRFVTLANAFFPPGCDVRVSGGRMEVAGSLRINGLLDLSGGEVCVRSSSAECYGGIQATGGRLCVTNARNHALYLRGGTMALSGSAKLCAGCLIGRFPAGTRSELVIAGGDANFIYTNGVGLSIGYAQEATATGGFNVRMNGGKVDMGKSFLSFQVDLDEPGVVEFSGGEFSHAAGFYVQGACTKGGTIIIRGRPSVSFEALQGPHSAGVISNSNRAHLRFEIDDGELNPLYVNASVANAGSQNLRGVFSLHPYGGFQLKAGDYCTIITSRADMASIHGWGKAIDPYFRSPNPGLWHSAFGPEKRDGSVGNITYRSTLTNAAEIANGFTDASGVPFGWFAVPPQKRTAEWLRVRMGIAAKGTNTVEGIVAGMCKAGYSAKVSAAGDCNVQVDLPVDRVGVGNSDRRVIFDFTTEDSPLNARDGIVTTNAVVTAFRFEQPKSGLMILLR